MDNNIYIGLRRATLIKNRSCCRIILLSLFFVIQFSLNLFSQKPSIDFSQGSNQNKTSLGEITWINGILNNNNSKIYLSVSREFVGQTTEALEKERIPTKKIYFESCY